MQYINNENKEILSKDLRIKLKKVNLKKMRSVYISLFAVLLILIFLFIIGYSVHQNTGLSFTDIREVKKIEFKQ